MKREVRCNDATKNSLFQVLYHGKHKEIFFFYKEDDLGRNQTSKEDMGQTTLNN